MCRFLEKLERYCHSSSSDDVSCKSWTPLAIHPCFRGQQCEDETSFVNCLKQYLLARIERAIDPKTIEPIVETRHRKDFVRYSELDRILDLKKFSDKDKATLIRVPSSPSLQHFLQDLIPLVDLRPEVGIYAMILLDRFLKASGWKLRATHWRILLLVSIRIAQKMEEDSCVSSQTLCEVYGIYKPEEFYEFESIFLRMIKWDCSISNEEYLKSAQNFFNEEHDLPIRSSRTEPF